MRAWPARRTGPAARGCTHPPAESPRPTRRCRVGCCRRYRPRRCVAPGAARGQSRSAPCAPPCSRAESSPPQPPRECPWPTIAPRGQLVVSSPASAAAMAPRARQRGTGRWARFERCATSRALRPRAPTLLQPEPCRCHCDEWPSAGTPRQAPQVDRRPPHFCQWAWGRRGHTKPGIWTTACRSGGLSPSTGRLMKTQAWARRPQPASRRERCALHASGSAALPSTSEPARAGHFAGR